MTDGVVFGSVGPLAGGVVSVGTGGGTSRLGACGWLGGVCGAGVCPGTCAFEACPRAHTVSPDKSTVEICRIGSSLIAETVLVESIVHAMRVAPRR